MITLTGTYKNRDAIRNTLEDLLATGIDREKVFVDEDHTQIKVMVPDAIRNEVTEILNRHQPTELH
ncbi:MAG: hypothetical protein Kow006_32840 [Gammaproteobacteria bacterium]